MAQHKDDYRLAHLNSVLRDWPTASDSLLFVINRQEMTIGEIKAEIERLELRVLARKGS